MQINYDFPWYFQNSEGFMALYTGLYNTATTISPIALLDALDIEHATTALQLKFVATLYGLRSDWVGIEQALIYNVKKWSGAGGPVNLLTPESKTTPTTKEWRYFWYPDGGLVLEAGKTYTFTCSDETAYIEISRYASGFPDVLRSGYRQITYTPVSDTTCQFRVSVSTGSLAEDTVVELYTEVIPAEENYWSGLPADTFDLLKNYIKAKVQMRNKNLTLQNIKNFFAVCLGHREFDPDTAISVDESLMHFDLTVTLDEGTLGDMVTLLSIDPYPFGKPTGISYTINYILEE